MNPELDRAGRRRLLHAFGLAMGASLLPRAQSATLKDEIGHEGESIRQEIELRADRLRVYQTLTEGPRFDELMQFIPETQGATPARLPASQIGASPGTTFTLFGGQIAGYQLTLRPSELIVQAWRANSWAPGEYSIARFELTERAGGTLIKFEHLGFPHGYADSLASGWRAHYWQPMSRYFA